MKGKFLVSILFVLTGALNLLSLSAQSDDIYEQTLDIIYDHLDNDQAERNIGYIDSFSTSSTFQSFSCFQQGKIYHLLGVSHYTLDEEEKAISVFQDLAIATWENCEEVPDSERANTIFNIGVSYQYTDEPHHAKKFIEKALHIFEQDTDYDPLYLAQNYRGAGNYYIDINDISKAESCFLNALNIYDQVPNSEIDKFDLYNLLILLNLDFKDFRKASEYYTKAIESSGQAISTLPSDLLGQVYLNGAIALRGIGSYQDASSIAHKGLSVLSKKNNPESYSIGLEILGTIEKETGSYKEAQKHFQDVLVMRMENVELHSSRSKSIAYENIGELLIAQGKYDEASEYIQKALIALGGQLIFDSEHNPIVAQSIFNHEIDVLRILSLKSEIFQERHKKEKDGAFLKTALSLHYKIDSIIGRNITTYQSEYSRLQIYDLIVDYYGKGIEVAIHLAEQLEDPSYIHDAYYFSSKSKGLILRSQISEMKALESVASPDMIAEERRLSKRINDIKESINNLSEAPDTLMRDYLQAQVELDVFILNIENENPEYYNRKHAFKDQLSVSDIQNKIEADQVILEYFFSEEKLYSFWIMKDDFFYLSIDNNQELKYQLESYLSQAQIANKPISASLSHSLYNELLSEGISRLSEDQTYICVIPDGLLHSLPFEALETSDRGDTHYLIEDYIISMSYASHLLFSEETANNGKKSYVGFGTNYNTDLSSDLQKLSFIDDDINLSGFNLSETEVQQASKLFSGTTFLNKDASTTNFQDSAREADIIHLSLHGLVNTDDPTKSCIVFDNSTDDFILTASDLYSYKINAELVVLSSCHTASGKIYRGEGVQGMTKAFVLAGADHIVSSIWSASERTSSDILTTFLNMYNDGISMPIALRQAKLDYLKNASPSQRHPYYWANYVLIGAINDSANKTSIWAYILGFGVLLLLGLTIINSYRSKANIRS